MSEIISTRPRFSDTEIRKFARDFYGHNVSVRPLESDIDQNFHLTNEMGEEFVFKVTNRGAVEIQSVAPDLCPYPFSDFITTGL